MSDVALDTSAAVPLLVRSHTAHRAVIGHLGDRHLCLTGHSLAETYSVLTRLPGDARVEPVDAATLLDAGFDEVVLIDDQDARALPALLGRAGIAGGAVYDALVALAARSAGVPLATRDRRAASTYAALDVAVDLIA